jgi:uncharacterized membrane protein YdjX (TVP38/TMEM64 family)
LQLKEQIKNIKRMKAFWRRVHARALIPYIFFGMLIIAAVLILGEEIDHHLKNIEGWISNLGSYGILVYVLLFITMTSFFFPDTLMGIIAGTLFGLKLGCFAIFTGFLAGSAFQYWLSGNLLRGPIEHMVATKPNLLAIQQAVRLQEFRLQLLLRLTPISPVMLSYILGVSGVRFSTFLIACFLHLPIFFLEVYFGYAGKHIARMAGRTEFSMIMDDVLVIVGLVSAILVVFLISRKARQAIENATSSQIYV